MRFLPIPAVLALLLACLAPAFAAIAARHDEAGALDQADLHRAMLVEKALIGSPAQRAAAERAVRRILIRDRIEEETDYYDVYGRTSDGVRSAIDEAQGVEAGGLDYDGKTIWRIEWNVAPIKAGETIAKRVSLTCRTTILLPHWVPYGQPSPDLAPRWARYIAALKYHEEGHALIARACAAAIRSNLRFLPDNATLAMVNLVANKTIDQYASLEKQYDHVTRHGALQGATFP